MKYYHESKSQVPSEQKWVVYFQASGTAYESKLNDSPAMGTALKANVLWFNYRGVSAKSFRLR